LDEYERVPELHINMHPRRYCFVRELHKSECGPELHEYASVPELHQKDEAVVELT